MAGEVDRRDPDTGRLAADGDPDPVFEVRLVDGVEAERLRTEQARVISEVVTWLAHNRIGPAGRQQEARG
jgi:hypothetical protein